MSSDLAAMDYERFWRRLQQLGLTAYEARSYLVLVGHPRFKALELAARAQVPRQKIYEVLDGLIEKGFAQVVQDKTKLFSAVEPSLALTNYLQRRNQTMRHEWTEQSRLAGALVEDLTTAFSSARDGRGTLDFLHLVAEPNQAAAHYRRMLAQVQREYVEFCRPPYAVDPLDEQLVKQARERGVKCRLLVEADTLDDAHQARLVEYAEAGMEIAEAPTLPLKLALFDCEHGLIALLDPVVTKPAWTSIVFSHPGMGEAMQALFDEHWRRAMLHLQANA